jgi:ubiquinone biosynthesis protein
MVLSRFGPRLPQMAQDALLSHANTLPPPRRSRVAERLAYLVGGVLLAFASVAVWEFWF